MELRDDLGTYKDIVKYRLDTAEEDLRDAKVMLSQDSIRTANNRAYYAIYHAISAVHALDEKAYKRHKDAISNFNKNYISTGIFPKKYGRQIVQVEEIRHESDYSDFYIAKRAVTEEVINTAEELIMVIKVYVEERLKS